MLSLVDPCIGEYLLVDGLVANLFKLLEVSKRRSCGQSGTCDEDGLLWLNEVGKLLQNSW